MTAAHRHHDLAPTRAAREAVAEYQAYRFTDMRLKVGDRIQIQPPASLTQDKSVVRMIGYQEGVSVLTTPPYANGLPLPLREGENVVVRVFSGQHAFGFTSTIEKICKAPFEYLHLSFPDRVQGLVVRKSPRVQTKIVASAANVSRQTAEGAKSCIISNLSVTGALVVAQNALAAKDEILRLSFRFSPLGVESYLSAAAVVRAVFEARSDDNTTLIHHGLEFQQLEPSEKITLGSFVYEQMVEEGHLL